MGTPKKKKNHYNQKQNLENTKPRYKTVLPGQRDSHLLVLEIKTANFEMKRLTTFKMLEGVHMISY